MLPMPDFVGSFGPWIGGLLVLAWLALNTVLVWRQRGKARQDVARLEAEDSRLDTEKAANGYVKRMEERLIRLEEQLERSEAARQRCEESRKEQITKIDGLKRENYRLLRDNVALRDAAGGNNG